MTTVAKQIGTLMARELFEFGSEPSRGQDGIVRRIEFKGGEYMKGETNLGGLCEEALALRLAEFLENSLSK